MKKSNITLLILPSVLDFILYWIIFGNDPFPPINDPAIWLKNAHALLGNTYPLWNQTLLQYPPFFNMILALFIILTHNSLISLKILGILTFSLLPLSIYPLAKEVTNNTTAGIIAVWLMAFHPAFAEMYGWGGYPNLLGIIFLNITIYFLYKIMEDEKINKKHIVLASLFASLIAITHHLTIIIYAIIGTSIIILAFYNIITKHQKHQITILIPIITSIIIFIIWRILAGPFQYLVFNYSSLMIRPFDIDAFWWIFKDPLATALLLLTAISGSIGLYIFNKKEILLILLVWALSPFIITQSYIFGIALDPKRFPMFAIPAITILTSSNIIYLKNITSKTLQETTTDKILLISLLILTIIMNTIIGATTAYKVNDYYHYITDYAYHSSERLEALNWIKQNTPQNATFVADETMGRWIEGYAQRRTLIELPPYQIFITGELERYEASALILSEANIELRNQYVQILDDTPYHTKRTPWIKESTGENYENTVYLIDGTVQTYFTYAGNVWIESPYNSTVTNITWIIKNSTQASISITYHSKSLSITKIITLMNNSKTVDISYIITPRINATLQKTEIPIWIPYGSTLNNYIHYSKTLRVIVDGKTIEIKGNGNYTIGPDPKWGQTRILYTITPINNTIKAELHITLLDAIKSWWNNKLWAYTSDEIIKKYNIEYIAISKAVEDYTKFLTDKRLTLVYENRLIMIFKINQNN